ncbi:MAG: flagellar assembly lytic transglycosylase [Treponema sp.]
MRRYLKLIISVFCFFTTTFLSCQSNYSSEFAKLIRDVKLKDFSSLLPLTDKKMKRILKADEAALLCIAIYLKEGENISEAQEMLRFSINNCKEPFNIIAKEKLYEFSDDEQRILLLQEDLEALAKDKKEEREKIEENIKELLFFTGQFDKLNEDIPSLFSKRAMNYKTSLTYELLPEDRKDLNEDFHNIMKIRLAVYEKKYNTVYKEAKDILLTKPILALSSKYIYYDFLKVFLFGSKEYVENAKILENLLENKLAKLKTQNTNAISYLTSFYIARLYEKAGNGQQAVKNYNIAVKKAPSPYDKDDSNWYKLSFELKNDFPAFMKNLELSFPKWDNHYWYEDLVSRAIMKIITERKYTQLLQLYKVVSKSRLAEQKAKLQYLMARSGVIANKYIEDNYNAAYKNEHNLFYYTLLSAYQLNAPIKDVLYKKRIKREANPLYAPQDAMKILKAYLDYGLYSYVYKETLRIYPTIKIDEAFNISKELRLQSLLPDSINLMQFVASSEGSVITEEHLRAIYPRPFYQEVSKWAKEYEVPEYIFYALVRSESFFRPLVVSHAGAIGLSQLMPATAKDIARSLKLSSYDVRNPDTNVRFGSYYLSRMLKRFDGRLMPSMCSYNAGPIAVSRWLKNTKIKEEDLFVETIPYDETRNYGKKLLSTACIYGMLYYNKTTDEVIREIYKDIEPFK